MTKITLLPVDFYNAEGAGFEPAEPIKVRQFSKLLI